MTETTIAHVSTVCGFAGGKSRDAHATLTATGKADTVEDIRKLLAAAPDLLAAAKLWLKTYDDCVKLEHLGDERGIAELRAAIAKATT